MLIKDSTQGQFLYEPIKCCLIYVASGYNRFSFTRAVVKPLQVKGPEQLVEFLKLSKNNVFCNRYYKTGIYLENMSAKELLKKAPAVWLSTVLKTLFTF